MHIKYPVNNVVSIWVGTFSDEDVMDQCTDDYVAPSLNLSVPLSSICEIAFEQNDVPVRKLLEGFSGWESFIVEACKIAKNNHVIVANGALVCYYLACQAASDHWQGITFLGTFVREIDDRS